jgi:hypothetical protein
MVISPMFKHYSMKVYRSLYRYYIVVNGQIQAPAALPTVPIRQKSHSGYEHGAEQSHPGRWQPCGILLRVVS